MNHPIPYRPFFRRCLRLLTAAACCLSFAGTSSAQYATYDGVLFFADQTSLEATLAKLQVLGAPERERWEAAHGFTSQRTLWDRVVEAEHAHLLGRYEGLSDEQLASLTAPVGHSAEYDAALAAERIVERDDTYVMNLAIPGLAPILDPRGFYVVDTTIYQVQGCRVKELRKAVFPEFERLAKATSNDKEAGITITEFDLDGGDTDSISYGSFTRDTNWMTSGSRRGRMQVRFTRTLGPGWSTTVSASYTVIVESQRKNFWGNWLYASGANYVSIGGSWTASFDMGVLSNLGSTRMWFPASVAWSHPSANNVTLMISPMTGAIAAGTSYRYTAPAGLYFREMSLTPMNWTAQVPGGSSGITLQLGNN